MTELMVCRVGQHSVLFQEYLFSTKNINILIFPLGDHTSAIALATVQVVLLLS